jgi:polyisoprenyl-phosphate glycosyltransferase
MEATKKSLEVIVPCYNEEGNIVSLINEIDRYIDKAKYRYRYVFVDDGSSDETCIAIDKTIQSRNDVCLIKLSRNFGKEAAIAAGLIHCTADAAIVIDADLQHPPYLIQAMISEWENGANIVDAIKVNRSKEPVFRRAASLLFNRMLSRLSGIDFSGATDYKLLDRKAISSINAVKENTRFFRGITNWIGLVHRKIEFQVDERNGGNSKWSLFSLLRLSIDAVASFSQKPLQIVSILGIFTLVFSAILGIQTLYNKFCGDAVSGFTTVIMVTLLLASIIMIGMGVLGIYLAKIYDEVKGRPICIVEKSGVSDRAV